MDADRLLILSSGSSADIGSHVVTLRVELDQNYGVYEDYKINVKVEPCMLSFAAPSIKEQRQRYDMM